MGMATRGEVLNKLKQPETEETLAFENKLADYLFCARCDWEAKHPKPTNRQRIMFELWVMMIEERERDNFYWGEG
jgi:hypothetical protein